MENVKKTALLVGASGLVGSELLDCLIKSETYEKIHVFVRKSLNIKHSTLEQHIIDFERLEEYKEYMKVNDIYCCLGTTIKSAGSQAAFRKVDFEYPVEIACLAQESGVQKFLIITALGAKVNSKIFYSRVKGETEEKIKQFHIPSIHIFQPSLLLGKRKEVRFGEKIASIMAPLYSILMIGALKKYKPIQARNVAQAMYKVGQKDIKGTYTYESAEILRLSNYKL